MFRPKNISSEKRNRNSLLFGFKLPAGGFKNPSVPKAESSLEALLGLGLGLVVCPRAMVDGVVKMPLLKRISYALSMVF